MNLSRFYQSNLIDWWIDSATVLINWLQVINKKTRLVYLSKTMIGALIRPGPTMNRGRENDWLIDREWFWLIDWLIVSDWLSNWLSDCWSKHAIDTIEKWNWLQLKEIWGAKPRGWAVQRTASLYKSVSLILVSFAIEVQHDAELSSQLSFWLAADAIADRTYEKWRSNCSTTSPTL